MTTNTGHSHEIDVKLADEHYEQERALQKGTLAPVLKSDFDELSVWKTIVRFKKSVFVCMLLCIAAAADGYQINMNGNIIANKGFINQIGFPDSTGTYSLNANYTALWGALQSLGQLIGMVLLNPVSDRIGRKMTLYLLWLILFGSILMETFVKDWKQWAGAKLLAGVGVGCIQATLPIYLTEWAPNNIRGLVISAYSVWNQLGNFLAPVILLALKSPNQWRVAIYTQWAFLGFMLPIFLWLPETPAYFASKNQHDKGVAALRKMNGGVKGYDIEAEYAIIKNTIEEEKRLRAEFGLDETSWRALLSSYLACLKGVNFKRTLGSSLPLMAQQLTGLSFLSTYASLFFKQSGFTNAFEITTIIFALKVGAVIVVVLTTDRLGRRNVTLGATATCTLMLLLVGILGQLKSNDSTKDALIFCACIWSCASATLSGVGYAYVGEVSAQKLRARTAGLATGMAVIFGLTFNTSVPIMLNTAGANWGYNTAWLFFATGLIVLLLSWYFLPETAQRNAAELDEMYEKRVAPWRMAKYETDVQKLRVARE